MPVSEWDGVDALIRELGSIRASADAIGASESASTAIENAIADAAEAVGATISAPRSRDALSHARATIATARERVSGLAEEILRARRVRQQAVDLGVPKPNHRHGEGTN
jgi:hypothetical protein